MTFDQALEIVLRHEGGYVNHPSDPGGETNFGITQRVARANGYDGDMRFIPMSAVRTIYRRQYWERVRADELPPELRLPVFDAAVNSGVSRAITWLQQAVGATPDGVFGPATLLAVAQAPVLRTAREVCYIRLGFLLNLETFRVFGAGWTRRVLSILRGI